MVIQIIVLVIATCGKTLRENLRRKKKEEKREIAKRWKESNMEQGNRHKQKKQRKGEDNIIPLGDPEKWR